MTRFTIATDTHSHNTIPLRALVLLLWLLGAAMIASAQSATDGSTPVGMAPGAPAGSYALSGFENVNLFNGHLNFHLPLLQVGGRGSAGYTINLNLERQWRTRKTPPPIVIYPETGPWGSLEVGYSPGVLLGRVVGAPNWGSCEENEGWRDTLTRLTFVGADGTEYELIDKLTMGVPQQTYYNVDCSIGYNFNRGKVFVTHDGSGVTFNSDEDILDAYGFAIDEIRPSGYLLMKDGTRYRIGGGVVTSIQDRNGNKVTLANVGRNITDSLNRAVTVAYYYDSTPHLDYDQISFKGTNGASRTIRIWKSDLSDALRSGFSIQTWQQLFPEMNGSTSNQFNPPVVSSVELPDGRRYWFKYNPYGELARVELPTGGAIEYDYAAGLRSGAVSGSYGGGGAYTTKQVYRRVVERRIYKDSSAVYESKMTISRPENSVIETDGYVLVEQRNYAGTLLASDKHYFHGTAVVPTYQTPFDYSPWQDGREWKTESLSLTGSVLRAVEHTWANPGGNPQITQSVTTLSDTNQVAKQTFLYDQYNNKTEVNEYAYGTGVSGALVRRTHTDYVTTNVIDGVSYNYDTDLAIHLRSLPSQVSIYDAGGVERARSTIEYDNYASDTNHAPLTPRANISGLDAAFTTSYTTRGNVTGSTRYLLVNGAVTGSISAYAQYDVAGNVVKTIDGRGNATNIFYTDCFGAPDGEATINTSPLELSSVGQASYAFPTTVTNAANQTVYAQFDYYLGAPVDGEDSNGTVSSGYYGDSLDRPTRVISAVNDTTVKSQATFAYDDANRSITTTSDQTTFNDNVLKSQTLYDGLGRTVESRQYEGGSNYIAAQAQYDSMGRAFKTSNPFRPWNSETAIWTTTGFDALGRVVSVTTPDSAVVTSAYSGNTVTVMDQTGKARRSVTDGLGRLARVDEPDSNGNLGTAASPTQPTSYSYDTLDNLTSVNQGSQTRSFVYDSLKRLASATNPESGTISYSYDNNGNLLTKTDARDITANYAYDALNRVTSRGYQNDPSGTPAVTYAYDTAGVANSKGKLTSVSSSVSSYSYSVFDAMGRVNAGTQTIGSQSYSLSYTYDLSGHVKTMTYPSLHTVTYNYDGAGRLGDKDPQNVAFTGNLGDGTPRTYATGISYSSLGGLQEEKFGTTTTPIYHKQRYNSRGQLWDMRASTVSFATDPANGDRGAIVNHYSNNFVPGGSGPDNNGNLLRQENYIPGSSFFQDNFTYDALNRLTSIAEKLNGTGTNTFSQTYTYDRWGNRLIDTDPNKTWGTGINNLAFEVENTSNVTNRLYAPGDLALPEASRQMQYDQAGNLKKDIYSGSAVTRLYDAENRMTKETRAGSVDAGVYSYDGDGRRVRRVVGPTETWQVYGLGGELLAEYAANTSYATPQKEYGYRNGQLLITATAGNGWGAPPTFADDPVQIGITEIRAIHLTELRDAINQLRAHAGLSAASWAEAVTPGVFIKADHISELRTKLDAALVALSQASGGYSAGLGIGFPIQAIHFQELRDRLEAAWSNGSAAQINWLVGDHLGTPRMIFEQTGSLAHVSRHDYLPFGEELVGDMGGRTQQQGYTASDNLRQKFTAKERDIETGLDYFLARYYASAQGRFTSPDPIIISDQQTYNPQLWNLYNYVGNNPLNFTDPTGMKIVRLGQHSDEWIDNREKQINQQLNDPDSNLTNAQRAALRDELDTNGLEKQGNAVAREAIRQLNAIGEGANLSVRDFTLSTDPARDLVSDRKFVERMGGKAKAQEIANRAANDDMFVLGYYSKQIFINTNTTIGKAFGSANAYSGSVLSDIIVSAASVMEHERTHRDGRTSRARSEGAAYAEHSRILWKFGPDAFKDKDYYRLYSMVVLGREAKYSHQK